MTIRSGLVATYMAMLFSLVQSANVFPIVGSHRYEVGITSIPLIDDGRHDPFAGDNNTARSVMVTGFYPVVGCRKNHTEPYMPPATAAFQDAKFATFGLPNGTFESLVLGTCESTLKSTCSISALPVVLFSGALGTSRHFYNSMLQSVAASGYYVISIDHPYDADIVEFPDGKVITAADISSDADVELAVSTRAQDITFVRRQLAKAGVTNKLLPGYKYKRTGGGVAVFGHSLGGAAAATSLMQDNSFRGALNIDGTMFGPVLDRGLDRPFMLIGHENKTRGNDPSWEAIWPSLEDWRREYEVLQTAHYSFSDLPLMLSVLRLPEEIRQQPDLVQRLGSLEGHRAMEITVSYITAFLDFLLKTGDEGILDGGSDEFPEVVEVE